MGLVLRVSQRYRQATAAVDVFFIHPTAALFPGGSYHTYDINFYYVSIRDNAALRAKYYFGEKP